MKHLVYIFLVFTVLLSAQQRAEFEKLSSVKGVTQSIIYDVEQDSIGNIWMATDEGVVRYNSQYSVYYNKYKGIPSEVGDKINTIFIDSKNNIWIGTKNAVCLYNRKLDVFENIKKTDDRSYSLIRSIIEGRDGNIWIGAYNGLWKCNPTTLEISNVTRNKFKGELKIQSLLNEMDDDVIIGTEEGLYVYTVGNDELTEIKSLKKVNILSVERDKSDYLLGTKSSGLLKISTNFKVEKKLNFSKSAYQNFPIRAIFKDKSGNYYLGTDGDGVYYLDKNYKEIDHYTNSEDDVLSISSDGVYDLLIDQENILWVATYGGGVNYFDRSKSVFKKIQHVLNSNNSLKNNFSRAIEMDTKGNFWFGTKKGVSIYNVETKNWTHINQFSEIVLDLESDNDFIWVGTFNNGVYKININTLKVEHMNQLFGNALKLKKIYTVFKDKNENIWLGGIEADLTKISKSNEITTYPIRDIKSIEQFWDGNVIVAGRLGVHIINSKTDEIQSLETIKSEKSNLNYFTINTILNPNSNDLIIGTNGAGIIFYNLNNDTYKVLNKRNGLPSDIVQGIIGLGNNEYWASTANGLTHIKLTSQDSIINIFDKEDGLTSSEFNYGSFKKVSNSLIAFGGVDGITYFDPGKVKYQANKPKVIFEEFSIFNKVVEASDEKIGGHINSVKEISLKNRESSISFKFLGVLHNSTNKIKYSWKLKGFNNDWSVPSSNNTVSFTNLKYGDYTFYVKAANRIGDWGELRQIKLSIARPWWLSWPAYLLYLVLFVVIILVSINMTRILVGKKIADEQVEFFNNLTHEIRTPLTILLSALDDVSKSSNDDSNKLAKKTIQRLNALFDQMLNFRKVTSNNQSIQTIRKINLDFHIKELLNNFAPLLKEHNIRAYFVNKWEKEVFYFDKEALNKILFNLVSNAIKYTPDNGEITIKILETSKGNDLVIEVIDTGIGIPADQQKYILKRFYRARNVVNSQKPGTGLGLMMVKKLVDKTNGNITFKSVENEGATFKVLLKDQEEFYTKSVLLEDGFQKEFNISDHADIAEYSDSKILIVEDNDELRELLSRSLGTFFQVYEASNGKEGYETANEIFPDIILTDLIMPVMDGLEMSKKIVKDINLNHIPIFMMTVLNNSALKIESIETGISEYIEKPIDINLLLVKIANSLSWQNKLRKKYLFDNAKDEAVSYRNAKDEEFVNKLEGILLNRISDSSFSVHDLCDSMGMSRTSLYMKLKNLIDLSPQDFIIHTRLKYAKSLLIKGELNIKEIAYQSGFSNPKYFSTSFKKYYGVTPSSYLDNIG